jgi:hypothetical protein
MSDNDLNRGHEYDEEPIVGDAPPKANVLLSDGWYNRLMPVAQIWLPALAVFYISIAPLWGLPKQEEVAGTIMALNLLLGAVLGISNKQYKNSDARFGGVIDVVPNRETGNTDLNVSLDTETVATKDEVVVKINRA